MMKFCKGTDGKLKTIEGLDELVVPLNDKILAFEREFGRSKLIFQSSIKFGDA